MGVLDELDRPRPAVLDGVAHAVQRPDARVAAVGEDHPLDAPEADHLVEEDVRRQPDHGEIGEALAQQLMAGGERDEVREALEGDEASIPHQRRDGFGQRLESAGLPHPGPPHVRSSCAHMCATGTHYRSAVTTGKGPSGRSNALDGERHALADADAQRGQAAPEVAVLEPSQEPEYEPHARGAERMADRDRTAVGVDGLGVEPQAADARDDLRRERLVDLDGVEIRDLPAACARGPSAWRARGRGP